MPWAILHMPRAGASSRQHGDHQPQSQRPAIVSLPLFTRLFPTSLFLSHLSPTTVIFLPHAPTLSAFRHRTAVPEKDGRVHGPAGALAQSASLAAAVPAKATVGAWDQFPDGWVGGIGAGDIGAAWPGITGAAPS